MSLKRFSTVLIGALLLQIPGPAEQPPGPTSTATPKGVNAKNSGEPLPPGALFRCGTSLELQRGTTPSLVALSADAKRMAVADAQAIRVQDPATGKELWRRNASLMPMALAFSPSGTMLAGTDYVGVHLLDARTGKPVRDLVETRARMSSLDFSADGRVLATGSEGFGYGNTVRVWDTATGKRLCAFKVPHDRTVYVALSMDGKTLACWGSSLQENHLLDSPGSKVQLWDVANNRSLRRISCAGQVLAVAFSADGKKLAASSGGGFRQPLQHDLFDAGTGNRIRTLQCQAPDMTLTGRILTFSPDGNLVAGTGYGGAIFFWESATGKGYSGVAGPTCEAQGVVFADGRSYAFGSAGSEVHVWDARTGELVRPVLGHTGPVQSIAFLRGGQIISEARGREIRLWDGANGHIVRGYFLNTQTSRSDGVGSSISRMSPGGKFILLWRYRDERAQLFDASTGRKLRDVGTFVTPLSAWRPPVFCFSADDQLLLIQGRDLKQGAAADLYETGTGRLLRHFEDGSGPLANVAISPDHRLVALAIGGGQQGNKGALFCKVRVFEADGGKERCSFPICFPYLYSVPPMAFATDGEYLLVQSNEAFPELGVWDVSSGKKACGLRPALYSSMQLPSFSPDGRTVAAVLYDHKNSRAIIQLSELCSNSMRREFHPPRTGISCLAFSPDGRKLAAGGQDSTILVWDVAEKAGDSSRPLSPEARSSIWTDLAAADASRAYQAMTKLYAAPREAVDFIRANLKPAAAKTSTQQEIASLLRKLDSPRFRERTKASAELSGVGESAVPLLRKTLESSPSSEVRERVQQLLDNISRARFAPDMMRPLRALEVLEHINSPESRALLESYAQGSADAPLTKWARSSLDRLARSSERTTK